MMKSDLNIQVQQTQNDENIFCRFEPLVGLPLPNKIYNEDCKTTMKRLPDKSVSLIIADPPYYKIKGEFDWAWETFDEYLNWMEELAIEFKRILADNGSLFVYSHAKRVAYIQVIFDRYFNLENNMVWRKVDSIQYQYYSIELSRSFNTHNERLLFYSNEYDSTGNEIVFENFIKPQNPFSKYLQEEFARAGVTRKEIAQLFPSKTGGLTGCVSNWLNGDNVITEEQYLKIREYLNGEYLRKEYEELRKEYEELRKEYEELRRPFNNVMKLEDVLTFSQEGNVSKFFDHETIKPLKMTKALIGTCSREGDLIYIPFVGSGTECVAVNELNRKFIGSEINKKYCEIAEARIKGSRINYDLFYD